MKIRQIMASSQAERDKFWAYVTVFGTLWGGLELTLGTFLHVLHVPKTGFIMCTLSIILLIAQRKIFPARGSSICTAIIAACIKCLSPGGIIAGPVFGILSEALVVELALLAAPAALPAAMFAGALTLTWSQIQSVVKIWIYYGEDFIDVVAKLISKFFSVEWTSTLGWSLLGLFFGITFVCGALAGLIGSRLGRNVLRQIEARAAELPPSQAHDDAPCAPSDTHDNPPQTLENASSTHADIALPDGDTCAPNDAEMPQAAHGNTDESRAHAASEQDGSTASPSTDTRKDTFEIISSLKVASKRRKPDELTPRTRAMVAPVALLTLIMQIQGVLLWSAIALAIWLAMLGFKARNVLKAIWWPKFWAITLVISLLGGLILAWDFAGNWNWLTGLEATARMMIRGCYVFSLITWATRAVRPKEILSFWNKVHLPGLGTAITNAYQILPKWLDLMNDMLKNRPKGRRNTLKYISQCFSLCLLQAVLETQDTAAPTKPQMP